VYIAKRLGLAASTLNYIRQEERDPPTNHSELRGLRSEGIHFKNKYKFMILKITMMPHIQEAFV